MIPIKQSAKPVKLKVKAFFEVTNSSSYLSVTVIFLFKYFYNKTVSKKLRIIVLAIIIYKFEFKLNL